MSNKLLLWISLCATLLAFGVVTLGAYVRLSDAGLGCPDWPGCYGHMIVPDKTHELAAAQSAFPDRPVEAHKAWKEMLHRYVAGTLGLLILLIAVLSYRFSRRNPHESQYNITLPLVLVVLVVFQALLGMWTVTLLLKPLIVVAHLLGGMATLSLLWWLTLRQSSLSWGNTVQHLRPWAILGLIIVVAQISLGGWTSANYAALICGNSFPTCQGYWLPTMTFQDAFTLWHGLGKNYEGGILSTEARVAIQFVHRLGALVTFLFIGGLALHLLFKNAIMQKIAIIMLSLLIFQISLGIANVWYLLPMPVAVAHNGVAALLLLSLVTLNYALTFNQAKESRV